MDDKRERRIRLLDAIIVCINEHPVVNQWITEILDRKTESQTCENRECKNYDTINDHCRFIEQCYYEPKTEPQMEESQVTKQCHKPSSLYYRCYCNESKNDEYCNGCEFWYEPQKYNIKAIKDLQEYCGIKQEPMLSEMV